VLASVFSLMSVSPRAGGARDARGARVRTGSDRAGAWRASESRGEVPDLAPERVRSGTGITEHH
jgi:hypothetical protein